MLIEGYRKQLLLPKHVPGWVCQELALLARVFGGSTHKFLMVKEHLCIVHVYLGIFLDPYLCLAFQKNSATEIRLRAQLDGDLED